MCKFIYLLLELDEEDKEFTFEINLENLPLDPTKCSFFHITYFLQNRTFDNPNIIEFEQCVNSFTCWWNLMKKMKMPWLPQLTHCPSFQSQRHHRQIPFLNPHKRPMSTPQCYT